MSDDTNPWRFGLPTVPGEYEVRHTSFGSTPEKLLTHYFDGKRFENVGGYSYIQAFKDQWRHKV